MKVSIIVPIYNVSKYLNGSLSTILSQDYNDYEVIMINDGSTDDSLRIAKKFEHMDTRFKVYSTVNQGLSAARNEGLKHVKGNIIYFMDADDQLAPNALSIFVKFFATHPEVDVIHFSSSLIPHPLINVTSCKLKSSCILDHKTALKKLMELELQPTAWSNISRVSVIKENGLLFSKGRLFEDENFNAKLFALSNKIGILVFNSGPYYYLIEQRKGKLMSGILHHKNLKQLKDRLFIVNDEYHFLVKLQVFSPSYLSSWYLNKLIWIYNNYFSDVADCNPELFKKLKNEIVKVHQKRKVELGFRQQVQYWKVQNIFFYYFMIYVKKIADVFRKKAKKL